MLLGLPCPQLFARGSELRFGPALLASGLVSGSRIANPKSWIVAHALLADPLEEGRQMSQVQRRSDSLNASLALTTRQSEYTPELIQWVARTPFPLNVATSLRRSPHGEPMAADTKQEKVGNQI